MFKLGDREILVGLGSNSTRALARLRQARECLRREFVLRETSPIYESDALLPEGAPVSWNQPFLNAACRLEIRKDSPWVPRSGSSESSSATERACAIVATLKRIERELGRVDGPRWSPREVDLDLLAWGGPDVDVPEVTVPHRELKERPFALLPALDCSLQAHQVGMRNLCTEFAVAAPWRYADPEHVPQRTRRSELSWSALVGIVNLTPDSFSDGRAALGPGWGDLDVERQIRALIAAGASVIDLGAESTRPGATPVSAAEEIRRLAPHWELVGRLRQELGFELSLDTRHAETAVWATERDRVGIDWLNDVGGLEDPRLLEFAARTECQVVVMHSLGVPPRREVTLDPACDPVAQILDWGEHRLAALARQGIPAWRVILDPGLGFGKTAAQHFALLERARELQSLPARVLIGHSRKRFLGERTSAPERDLETAVVSARLACAGVDFLRVHDPRTQARALAVGARQ